MKNDQINLAFVFFSTTDYRRNYLKFVCDCSSQYSMKSNAYTFTFILPFAVSANLHIYWVYHKWNSFIQFVNNIINFFIAAWISWFIPSIQLICCIVYFTGLLSKFVMEQHKVHAFVLQSIHCTIISVSMSCGRYYTTISGHQFFLLHILVLVSMQQLVNY